MCISRVESRKFLLQLLQSVYFCVFVCGRKPNRCSDFYFPVFQHRPLLATSCNKSMPIHLSWVEQQQHVSTPSTLFYFWVSIWDPIGVRPFLFYNSSLVVSFSQCLAFLCHNSCLFSRTLIKAWLFASCQLEVGSW